MMALIKRTIVDEAVGSNLYMGRKTAKGGRPKNSESWYMVGVAQFG